MTTSIVVPELGESVVEARVARWLKQPGEPVAAGDALVELETEKIDLEVSADRPGVLASIKHPEGADVKVGEVLAVLEESAPVAIPQVPQAPQVLQEDRLVEMKATPTAKNVAKAHDVNLAAVAASGARVTKDDVLRVAAPAGTGRTAPVAPPASRAPEAPGQRLETRQRMSKRRLTIARRLVEAQHAAAMLTTFNEVDMSQVMALRARRKDAFKAAHGVSLGIASFFVKAAIGALKAIPPLNAEIQGDEVVFKHYYDIGVAVAAEGGLVVPVLRDADRLTFAEIERAIRDVVRRADQGTLTLEDLKGGTFTITNGGVFGSLMSTPILNPPQVGILGLHKIADRAVAVAGQVVIRPMMYLALSYDHRLVDGREAVQFLVKIKELVEDPAGMLLES
jgi:2-oxoglutarate dehydrogenase E2 component (dihydrolipoamide succinyltransferase)